MTDDEDPDDDDCDAGEADIPLPQRFLGVSAVSPQLLADNFVAAEGAVNQTVEHYQQGRGQEQVHQPVGAVHVVLKREFEARYNLIL